MMQPDSVLVRLSLPGKCLSFELLTTTCKHRLLVKYSVP